MKTYRYVIVLVTAADDLLQTIVEAETGTIPERRERDTRRASDATGYRADVKPPPVGENPTSGIYLKL